MYIILQYISSSICMAHFHSRKRHQLSRCGHPWVPQPLPMMTVSQVWSISGDPGYMHVHSISSWRGTIVSWNHSRFNWPILSTEVVTWFTYKYVPVITSCTFLVAFAVGSTLPCTQSLIPLRLLYESWRRNRDRVRGLKTPWWSSDSIHPAKQELTSHCEP